MTEIAARKYILEVHDPGDSDALVTILENAHKIAYVEAVNEAPTLKFDLPVDDTKVANITKANEVWLRDYSTGALVNRFRLAKEADKRTKTLITSISTEGLLNQLADEFVDSYIATPEEDLTVTQIVTALLDYQVLTPKITVGTIDPDVTRSISVSGGTILKNIRRLRDTVGSYIYVDSDRAFQWRTTIGKDKGQQIRYRKNLKGITRTIDYTALANRLYAYGAGEGDARIKLSDVEEHEVDYIDDEASQGVPPGGWGGIYPKSIVDKSITHPDTLMAWAVLKLAESKNPRITYRVDAVDLSESLELDFSFEKLEIGSTVKVIDENLGIDVSAQVLKITHPDLLHPEQMRLEIANRTKDIAGTLAEVYDTQQLMQHIAVQIGAGQVTVKGVFTVSDWVTGEETTIDGANITTGTIDVDALKTSTLGAKTITLSGASSILKGNYEVGVSGWQIKGDGNAEFNNVTVRGNIQAGAGSVINWGYIPAGSGRPDNNADVTADHGQLYGWITGAKPPIDAEANPSYVHSTYISATSIYSPTIYGGTVYVGYTLTVNGAISAAGGQVILDADGIAIKDTGDGFTGLVKLQYGETHVGTIGVLNTFFCGMVAEANKSVILYTHSMSAGILIDAYGGYNRISPSIESGADIGHADFPWRDGYFSGCLFANEINLDSKIIADTGATVKFYPNPTETGNLGYNDKYWEKLWVKYIDIANYGQIIGPSGAGSRHGTATSHPEQTHSSEWVLHCNIPSFSQFDDLALLRSIQEKDGKLDTETFPDMLCVHPDMTVENAVIDARCKGKPRKEQDAIRQEANEKLSRKAISMGNWQSLNMGAILQVADRLAKLEVKVDALN